MTLRRPPTAETPGEPAPAPAATAPEEVGTATTLPLYRQLAERLLREIAAGHWLPGERLPTEAQLAAQRGLAVGTVRKALAELEARGLLERRQGSGTYLRAAEAHAHSATRGGVYGFFRLEQRGGSGPGLPGARVLSVQPLRPVPQAGPTGGGGSANGPTAWPAPWPARWRSAWQVRRLRLLDGIPVALEEIAFDASDTPGVLQAEDLHESLYHFYETRLGWWIAQVEDRLGLAPAPPWAALAAALQPGAGPGLAPGAPCVAVQRQAWSQRGQLAELSTTWFDPARACYTARWR